MNLETLPAPKLRRLIERLEAQASASTRKLIDAGYGNTKHCEIVKIAEAGGDPLCVEDIRIWTELDAARRERMARRSYQGNDRPIKRL